MAEQLTKKQVEAVVEFAEGLAYGEMYNVWTPWMSNAVLQDLNNDAKEASSKAVRKALSDYRNNADTIHSYMEYMTFFDMIFAKMFVLMQKSLIMIPRHIRMINVELTISC